MVLKRSVPLALCLALLVVPLAVPAGAATETLTEPYALGGFRIVGAGPSFLWGGIDLDDDGTDEVPHLGGANLEPDQMYANVIVRATDEVYGSDAASIVRMWDPDNEEVVQDPYSSGEGCGTRSLLGSPYATNEVSVHMYSILVADDLKVCGATAGTLTADFF